jgi:hypothetical protein
LLFVLDLNGVITGTPLRPQMTQTMDLRELALADPAFSDFDESILTSMSWVLEP